MADPQHLTISLESLANLKDKRRYVVDPQEFRQVPGIPFSYWVSPRVRRLFGELPAFEGDGRAVKQGIATADDFRFVRSWWEVPATAICPPEPHSIVSEYPYCVVGDFRWFPFAKGGAFAQFYADVNLLVNWQRDGEEIRNFRDPATGRLLSRPQNTDYVFRPGLTWSDRTTKLFSARCWPAGGVFSVKGSAGFFPGQETKVLGLMNTSVFNGFLAMLVGASDLAARSYQVGTIGAVPCPDLSAPDAVHLGVLSRVCVDLKRGLDTVNETSHVFHRPAMLQVCGQTLLERTTAWNVILGDLESELLDKQREIEDIAFRLYGIEGKDRVAMEESLWQSATTGSVAKEEEGERDEDGADEEDSSEAPVADLPNLVTDLISYCIGCAFGRFDVRLGIGQRMPAPLADPFAPLPVCSPGMLTGEDGLPLTAAPPGYPLPIDGDGILVDDADAETGAAAHPDDLVKRVEAVLALLFGDERLEAIEREACAALGVESLREYFRRPGAGGFWQEHIRRYSKSRRKAPIYWLLQSRRRSYALWLYYHRLDADILSKALIHYAEPKAQRERDRLDALRTQRAGMGESGREVRQVERRIEKQEALVAELEEFCARLREAADLRLIPDLNDGVVLTIAPLRELVPWAEARRYWDELRAGKYAWSSIAQQMREKGLTREAQT